MAKYKAASWSLIEVCPFQPIIEFLQYNLTGSLGSKLHRYIERDMPVSGAHQYICVGATIGSTETTMGPNEFRCLHAACLDLAGQLNVPGIRDRWLAMAQGWIELADNGDQLPEAPGSLPGLNLLQTRPH